VQIPFASFQTSTLLKVQMAVTLLDFSSDDIFLQMCCRKISPHDNTRDFSEKECFYFVWDTVMGQIVNDISELQEKELQWPNWSMSNSVFARY